MPNILPKRIRVAAAILLRGEYSQASPRESIPPISAEEVEEARSFFPMEKFFIYGHARSGTTLLSRLIRLHPQVHCNWQAHFFTRPPLLKSLVDTPEAEEWLSRRSNRWNRGRDLSPVALRAVADFIMERDARQAGKTIVGDKSPSSMIQGQAVRDMHAVYPDAYVIHILRDGRDVLISHRFQTFIEREDQLSREDRAIRLDLTRNPEPYLQGERSLFGEAGMRSAARRWVKTVNETHMEAKSCYGERYCSMRYEDLLARPWEEMQRVWQFLGAQGTSPELEQTMSAEMQSNPDADWQQEKNAEIAKSLQKGQQGNWCSMFTSRDRQIFKDAAGQTLIDWGYEKGMDW
jgi:hypothetical protein